MSTSRRVPLLPLFAQNKLRLVAAQLEGRLAQADLEKGHYVADLRTGSGLFLPELLKAVGPTGIVYATETRPDLLEVARKRVGHLPQVQLMAVDPADTGLPGASVDRVLLNGVFHELNDRSGTVREIRRILKPGGKLWLWEPHLYVAAWQVRAWEGMFTGSCFTLEWSSDRGLGLSRRFVASDEPPGSRLRA